MLSGNTESFIDKVNNNNMLHDIVFSGNTNGYIDLFNDYNKLPVFVVSGNAESLREREV